MKCSLIHYVFLFQNILGTTYPNQCSLDCAGGIRCNASDTTRVCATDTVSYANQCALNCAMQANETLRACDNQNTVIACYRNAAGTYQLSFSACQLACNARTNPNIRIECPPGGDAVCVTDLGANPDVRYPFASFCDYNCSADPTHFNFNLELADNQLCIDDCEGRCAIPTAATQVCGSNRVTYGSECYLKCSAIFDKTLRKNCDVPCGVSGCPTPPIMNT